MGAEQVDGDPGGGHPHPGAQGAPPAVAGNPGTGRQQQLAA